MEKNEINFILYNFNQNIYSITILTVVLNEYLYIFILKHKDNG